LIGQAVPEYGSQINRFGRSFSEFDSFKGFETPRIEGSSDRFSYMVRCPYGAIALCSADKARAFRAAWY
jgi:hypothetical protein